MANIAWNGSTATTGGQSITPLTELHAPDDPADFETGGSTDTTMPHGTGKDKCQVTIGFLGSHCPAAGVPVSMAFQIGVTGDNYKNTDLPGTPTLAFATQVTVSGHKDGRIEGSATLVPGDSSLTPVTQTWSTGDVGFNGSGFSFAGSAATGLVAMQYSGSSQPIDSTGAEAAAPVATVYVPGMPDEQITVTTLGPPQYAAKAKGATVASWNDGGTLGTFPTGASYTAECVSTHPGGSINGQATTEHTFRVRRVGAGAS